MGQAEILEFLYLQRASGNESYFKVKEIVKALRGTNYYTNFAINKQLRKLFWDGFIETAPLYNKKKNKTSFFCKYRLSEARMKTVRKMLEHNEKFNIVKKHSYFPTTSNYNRLETDKNE